MVDNTQPLEVAAHRGHDYADHDVQKRDDAAPAQCLLGALRDLLAPLPWQVEGQTARPEAHCISAIASSTVSDNRTVRAIATMGEMVA
jgi:hypothetical protein